MENLAGVLILTIPEKKKKMFREVIDKIIKEDFYKLDLNKAWPRKKNVPSFVLHGL